MTRVRDVAAVAVVLLGALPLLLLLDDDARVWAFRGYVVFIALLAARSIVRWTDVAGSVSADDHDHDPFRRPLLAALAVRRVRARRRRSRRAPLSGGQVLVHSAISTAGGAHHRLRPVLREVADERLRSRYGFDLDTAGPGHVGAGAWSVVDPSRPAPQDRLAPGLTADEIALALDDLEKL